MLYVRVIFAWVPSVPRGPRIPLDEVSWVGISLSFLGVSHYTQLEFKSVPALSKGRLAMLLSAINDDPIHDLPRDLHPDSRDEKETIAADR